MKNVYVITKNGNSYTNEGCDFITERIERAYNDKSKLAFLSGTIYNDPINLAKCIKKHPNCYIAISTAKDVVTIWGAILNELYNKLINANGKTSWEISTEMIDNLRNH